MSARANGLPHGLARTVRFKPDMRGPRVSVWLRPNRYAATSSVGSSGDQRSLCFVFLATDSNREELAALMAAEGERYSPRLLWSSSKMMDWSGGCGSAWRIHFCSRGRQRCSVDDVVDHFLPHCLRPPPHSRLPLSSPLRARRLHSLLANSWCKPWSSSPPLAQLLSYLFLLCCSWFPSLFSG